MLVLHAQTFECRFIAIQTHRYTEFELENLTMRLVGDRR
jgi:hypothetical protein